MVNESEIKDKLVTKLWTMAAHTPDKFPTSEHNANPPTIWMHLKLLCAPGGKELWDS